VINADFQELMRGAPDVTNVVEACNTDGRLERLENLLGQLEICEKALQDYLETKRISFPRFYFVAAADLLDILSKGSNPQVWLSRGDLARVRFLTYRCARCRCVRRLIPLWGLDHPNPTRLQTLPLRS